MFVAMQCIQYVNATVILSTQLLLLKQDALYDHYAYNLACARNTYVLYACTNRSMQWKSIPPD